MPWAFLVWLLCFFLQAALVGTAFYTLIQLYDFEEDLINNFDCAKRCNRLVVRLPVLSEQPLKIACSWFLLCHHDMACHEQCHQLQRPYLYLELIARKVVGGSQIFADRLGTASESVTRAWAGLQVAVQSAQESDVCSLWRSASR